MSAYDELLPCPFCGGEARLRGGPEAQETYSVWCNGEGRHHMDYGSHKGSAIAAWNKRADLAPQWQDIATAPKDKLIDIWLKDGVRWCDCYYDGICSEWRTSRPSGRLLRIYEAHVSHWMPIPTPPEPT